MRPRLQDSPNGEATTRTDDQPDSLHADGAPSAESLAARLLSGSVVGPVQPLGKRGSPPTRRALETSQSFLLALSDRLRPLRDAIEIQGEAVRLLGECLDADWAFYVEYDDDLAFGTIRTDCRTSSAPSLVGRHPLGEAKEFTAELAAGRILAENDIESSAFVFAEQRARYLAIGVRGYATAPVVKGKHLIAGIGVAFLVPHAWTPDEVALLRETADRTWESIERARAELAVANELADTKLLQTLSAQLIEEEDSSGLYEKIVDAAVSIMRSDFATLQNFHPERGSAGALQLITSRGFAPEDTQAWEWIGPQRFTSCAQALRTGARILLPDIEQAEFMAGTADQAAMLKTGARAGQTTPLVSRAGKTVGMISTYWRRVHVPSERDLRLLDLLARQAADLMERTQAAEALRRNEQRLKEEDRRKDEFLAVLAHELRNPLAPIRTGLELIRLSGDNPAAIEETRIMMERQLGHMVRLIDDLLDVSRIRSGKIQLRRQPTSLATLVNGAIEANREALVAARISFDVNLADGSTLIEVDPTRFTQVLSNVLHNAVKFTEPGGQIRVFAEIHEGTAHTKEATFVVADSGAGISTELLPRVFDLFVQDNASARGVRTGLGIGLALARQLVEMHGGAIDAHSEGAGFGSTFTIRLPLPTGVAAVESTALPHEPPHITRRVVVIDDNVDAANSIDRLVGVLGGECRVAYDGATGFAEVLAFHPDIVFLDIGMPGIDGYEVCRRIRREISPDVVIVALTGWGQEQDKADAAGAGFDAHLTKPADPLQLEALLSTGRPA